MTTLSEDDMKVLMAVRVISVVCIGLLAGINLADRASSPARAMLDASSFVQHQQTVQVTYVRMMPPLVIAAILAVVCWLFIVRRQWGGVPSSGLSQPLPARSFFLRH